MSETRIVGGKGFAGVSSGCDCEVDNKTLGGKGSRRHPFEVIGLLPQAPFPTISPSGALIQTTIYARPSGSDKHGDGSHHKPFATFARAILAVPRQINAGYGYVIDITGLGVENLPQDWTAPVITGEPTSWVGPITEAPWRPSISSLLIRAQPQLALSDGAGVVTAADAGMVTAVGGGADLTLLTIGSAARPEWAGGALKGKFVYKTRTPWTGVSSGNAPVGTIFDSSSTELYITNTPARFNNPTGVGALQLEVGESLLIVEPSATLQAPVSAKGDSLDFTAISAGLVFQGIRLQCDQPGLGNGGAVFQDQSVIFFEFCHLDGTDFQGCGSIQVGLFTCYLTDYLNGAASQLTPRWSYLVLGVTNGGFFGNLGGVSQFRQSVFDGCPSLTDQAGVIGPIPATGFGFLNVWFRDSQGDAIQLVSPTRLTMTSCQIDGSLGDAINLSGPLQATLSDVTGSGNTGYGVITDDGAHVQVDAAVTVGNADARAFTNGNNAPVAAWAGAPFNNVDATTFSRVSES